MFVHVVFVLNHNSSYKIKEDIAISQYNKNIKGNKKKHTIFRENKEKIRRNPNTENKDKYKSKKNDQSYKKNSFRRFLESKEIF